MAIVYQHRRVDTKPNLENRKAQQKIIKTQVSRVNKKSADSRRKITKEQVDIIHQLVIAGWTRGQIAVHLGITVDLVQKWKHQKIKT